LAPPDLPKALTFYHQAVQGGLTEAKTAVQRCSAAI